MIRVTWWELKEGVHGGGGGWLEQFKNPTKASEERLVVLLVAGRKVTSVFA